MYRPHVDHVSSDYEGPNRPGILNHRDIGSLYDSSTRLVLKAYPNSSISLND